MKERKLENQAIEYMNYKKERDLLDEKMAFLKVAMEKNMKADNESSFRVRYNADKDIKVDLGMSTRKKIDKEQIAEDLSVEVSAVKTDFLLKCVDDGKLSYNDYTGYGYIDRQETLSIRFVKAD